MKTFHDVTGHWGVNRNNQAVTFGWETEQGAEGYALRNYPGEHITTTDDPTHDPQKADPRLAP